MPSLFVSMYYEARWNSTADLHTVHEEPVWESQAGILWLICTQEMTQNKF